MLREHQHRGTSPRVCCGGTNTEGQVPPAPPAEVPEPPEPRRQRAARGRESQSCSLGRWTGSGGGRNGCPWRGCSTGTGCALEWLREHCVVCIFLRFFKVAFQRKWASQPHVSEGLVPHGLCHGSGVFVAAGRRWPRGVSRLSGGRGLKSAQWLGTRSPRLPPTAAVIPTLGTKHLRPTAEPCAAPPRPMLHF